MTIAPQCAGLKRPSESAKAGLTATTSSVTADQVRGTDPVALESARYRAVLPRAACASSNRCPEHSRHWQTPALT